MTLVHAELFIPSYIIVPVFSIFFSAGSKYISKLQKTTTIFQNRTHPSPNPALKIITALSHKNSRHYQKMAAVFMYLTIK